MAWILFSILIASTAASAYKFPYSNFYQPFESQDYGGWQYRRVEERSSETETGNGYGYHERARNYQNDDRHADSSEIHTERTVERSISYKDPYKKQGQGRAASLDDVQSRNGNTTYKVVNSLPKTYPSVTNRRGADSESAVVFPGPTSGSRKMFKTELTEDCGELGICENSPDYPHEYVEELIAKLPDANIRFNLDVETPEIAQRGGHKQSVELCKPDVRIIYPDKVRTKAGKVVFIVNGKEKKVQGFRGTQCKAPGKACEDLVYFPPNYTASCEQKMMDRYMWAIDENGVMEVATVPMPSCCMCVLQPKK